MAGSLGDVPSDRRRRVLPEWFTRRPVLSTQAFRGGGSNPWHDVKVEEPIDEWFWAFIEIPKGSKVKYELDKETGLLKVDRVLRGALSRELRVHPAVVLRRR